MALNSELEIAADNYIWLTYPGYLDIRLSEKELSTKFKFCICSKDTELFKLVKFFGLRHVINKKLMLT